MSIEERARQRRMRIESNRTTSFEEAELWDLEYWQSVTPEERLNAYMAIRRDVETVQRAKARDVSEKGAH